MAVVIDSVLGWAACTMALSPNYNAHSAVAGGLSPRSELLDQCLSLAQALCRAARKDMQIDM
jgi:hypothetical protein